jgi:potassium-dependent mechanosensitive channel
VDVLSAPSPDSLAIEQALPERSKRLQAGWEAIVRRLAGRPSAQDLEEMTIAWRGIRAELSTWADRLASQGKQLQQEAQHLSELHEVWAKSLKEVESAKAPSQVLQEINGILTAISAAQARLNARVASLLVLQYQVTLEIRRCDQVLSLIGQAKTDLVDHLATQDAPTIWNPALWVAAKDQFVPGIQAAGARWRRELTIVLKNRASGIALQAILFVMLLVPLMRARGRAHDWILPGTGISAAARMLERPASAALVLTLLATPFIYPSYAMAAFRMARLVGIIPALRLLTPLVPATQGRTLYGFGAVLAAEALRPFLSTAPQLDHLFFLAVMLGGSLLLGLIILAERRAHPATGTVPVAGRLAGRYVFVAILWLVFIVALLAGAAGYMQLARLIGDGALQSTYAAMAILIDVWVLLVLFAFALWARPLGALESVKRNRAFLEQRAGRVLRGIGAAVWVLSALQPLAIFGAPAGVARAVLGAGVAWGAVRITVGDVLLFCVTVWAAFALAAMVRTVLEADVFPRVRFAEGVPLALGNLTRYVIVLTGFILGMAALGVDLTKVTILVGAFGVGVGIGLQTLVANFAAGLILLFERPIREGDAVQVGDIQGQVRHIGVRASTVRTGKGADVFVPNAQLLTEKITNWTYTDRTLRIDLPVSVAYDTDPRRVIELLRRVAAAHPDVLQEPAPAAFCLGFGASGLSFELRMWTSRFERSDAIRSELAEAVCAALTEAKILFPQREVWLRMAGESPEGVWRLPSPSS